MEAKKPKISGDKLLERIVAETFARHSKQTDEEYKETLGFKGTDLTEEQIFRQGVFNVLTESTKELLKAKNNVAKLMAILKLHLGGQENDGRKEN